MPRISLNTAADASAVATCGISVSRFSNVANSRSRASRRLAIAIASRNAGCSERRAPTMAARMAPEGRVSAIALRSPRSRARRPMAMLRSLVLPSKRNLPSRRVCGNCQRDRHHGRHDEPFTDEVSTSRERLPTAKDVHKRTEHDSRPRSQGRGRLHRRPAGADA